MRASSPARSTKVGFRRSLSVAALGLAILAGLASGCGSEPEIPPTENRNVILIVVDTLRADATDGSWTETPGIDSLAKDGVRFTQAFSHAPITLPSHTAMFASRLPYETGVLNNWVPVRKNLPLFAEWLQEKGYQTHAVVSLGTLTPHKENETGLSRGFDLYDIDYWNMDFADRAFLRMRSRLDAIDTERPFFFFAHFSDPHEPYNSHAEYPIHAEIWLDGELLERVSTSKMSLERGELELSEGKHTLEIRSEETFRAKILDVGRYDENCSTAWELGKEKEVLKELRFGIEVAKSGTFEYRYWLSRPAGRKVVKGLYREEVEFVDRAIADLLEELRSRGLYEDSLIVFTSDHGEALGEHKAVGHVQNLHDEMLNVPLIIKLPAGHDGQSRLAHEADRLVPHTDLVPTMLEIIGVDPMDGQIGASLLGERSPLLVAETHRDEAKRNYVCMRDERYKLIYDPDAPEGEQFTMYDMVNDPEELEDVFASAGSEREEWMPQLEFIAGVASLQLVSSDERTPEEQRMLDAMGYGGGDEEN